MISPAGSRGPSLSTGNPSSRVASFAHAYDACVAKTRGNIQRLADAPKSGAFAKDGDYFAFNEGFLDIGNWTSSFFTGMALLAFRSTNDPEFLQQSNRLKELYREKVFVRSMDTMHDLGFLYTLYSEAIYKLTGDHDHREIALRAASELAKRFVPIGGYIRAWGRMDETHTEYTGVAIIDCLMNLPLLFWATNETGDQTYREIAVRHANTTLERFVRPDFSVCHSYRFDRFTGAPMHAENYCGRSIDSHWARGSAWAIYGFALAYRYTREEKFLDAALGIGHRFVELLDTEGVPVWDFGLKPGEKILRDSSAAAVAICGFDEILLHRPHEVALSTNADAMLERLCSPSYLDARPECRGVLRDAQIGDGVGKARSAYASWGDYFFMEALARRLQGGPGFW